jgi:hypothetical protein
VGEPFLNAEMQSQSQGAVAACSFCGKKGKTYSIEEVADRVATALEDHYSQTQSSRYGDPVLQVIQSVAEIDEEPAREILLVLREREGYTEGEEGKFDDEAHYVDAAASDWELHSEWLDFEKSIKTEARFFSPMAQEILARVFKDVGAEETVNGNPFVVEGGPGKTISALFRARTFQSNGKLEEALCRPDLKIGSPPSDRDHSAPQPPHLDRRGDAVGVAEDGRGVAVLDPVVLGLGPVRVARQPVRLAKGGEALGPAGDDLVDVGLVTRVPEDPVARRVEDPVQGERHLDDTEVGAEVATGARDLRHQKVADLRRQQGQLLRTETLEVTGCGDIAEQPGLGGEGLAHERRVYPRISSSHPAARSTHRSCT